jgi:hypothetical protein
VCTLFAAITFPSDHHHSSLTQHVQDAWNRTTYDIILPQLLCSTGGAAGEASQLDLLPRGFEFSNHAGLGKIFIRYCCVTLREMGIGHSSCNLHSSSPFVISPQLYLLEGSVSHHTQPLQRPLPRTDPGSPSTRDRLGTIRTMNKKFLTTVSPSTAEYADCWRIRLPFYDHVVRQVNKYAQKLRTSRHMVQATQQFHRPLTDIVVDRSAGEMRTGRLLAITAHEHFDVKRHFTPTASWCIRRKVLSIN